MSNTFSSSLGCDIHVTISPLSGEHTIEISFSTLCDFKRFLKSEYLQDYLADAVISYDIHYLCDGRCYEAMFFDWQVAYAFAVSPTHPIKCNVLND